MNIITIIILIVLYAVVIFITYKMLQMIDDGAEQEGFFVTMSFLWPITYLFLMASFPYFYTVTVIKKYKWLNYRKKSPRDFVCGKFDDIFDVESYRTHRLNLIGLI